MISVQSTLQEILQEAVNYFNPIVIKEAANLMGFDCGSCRMPLCDMTEQDHAKLAAIMKKYHLI